MHGPTSPETLDEVLNILEQSPGLNKLYTQICYCFSITNTSSHSRIIQTLTTGLENLSASFPWIAGQVVNEGSGDGNPGLLKIKPFEKIPILVVKDLTNDPLIPSIEDLRRAQFPFSMLDESIIAPRHTLPGDEELSPVFLLQANFIKGGLMLTLNGNHNAMDMVGQGHVIHLFSKACREEGFASEELSIGNISRRNLIPLLDDSYKPGPELAYQLVKSDPSPSLSVDMDGESSPNPPPTCSWAYFNFPSTSLATLKSIATKTLPPSASYISTDDALTAFIWQSVMRARLPRLNPTRRVKLARAVDVRRYLNIPQTYLGLMQNMTYHTYPIQQLLSTPLGTIASNFRLAVDPKTSKLGYNTSALATFLNHSADQNAASVVAAIDTPSDIMLSSWSNITSYDDDFGLGLGVPEMVRRPRFTPVESLLYLMPKTREGDVALGICLRDEDMERLRGDEEFMKFGVYIG